MSLFRMTQAEYDRLNPPPDILYTGGDGWHYVGHIPAPRTRLGWFIHDIIHGLAMRYRILPVLAFAFDGLLGRRERSATVIKAELDSDGNDDLWADYDDTTDTLIIYFSGKTAASVNWLDNRVATLLEDDTDQIVGMMIDGYKKNSPAQRQ